MVRKLYHGSKDIIEKPQFGFGKKIMIMASDFIVRIAWIWRKNGEYRKNRMDTPSGLALEAKNYLLYNFKVDYQDCDAMIGYRADDSYFSFAQDFISGTISCRQLNQAMHLGQLGQQFVLKSRRAFGRIHFLGYETVDYREWESALSFAEIVSCVPIREIQMLYYPYHEMDIRQFVDRMNELCVGS